MACLAATARMASQISKMLRDWPVTLRTYILEA